MEYIIKKTIELTDSEQEQLLFLFNMIFKKVRPLDHFRNQFLNNPLGYSWHAMMIEAKQVVGSVSYIPSYYIVGDERHLFALSVDAMVNEQHRGFINFYKMVITIYNYMREQGVVFLYVFPNDTAYSIYIKSKLLEDIGSLTTYCLPYRIGGIKPGLSIFNSFSIFFTKCYVLLASIFAERKVHHFPIEKEFETYNTTRYKRLDGDYKIINYKGSEFVYKIMAYEGIRSAFLVDVFEKSATNFNTAVRYIIKNHVKEFDILLYVGHLPFGHHGLLRVPQKFTPKNFHFTGKILKKEGINDELFFNLDNWDVNLSNYDLL
ncbi:hypothetical protein AGMMS49546_32370 [Spirochaetia bacterium]|nr:hypothetical protein AGMMS49546_32300 [Spirochaetia bacterium]GHV45764.1 hypothetical protein AGMMS49546_32370 [Spirochaetia bacterium]